MLLKPKLFQTQLSFFKTHSTALTLQQWTVSILGSGSAAEQIGEMLSPLCTKHQVRLEQYQTLPSVLLGRDNGWMLPFAHIPTQESHVCILALERPPGSLSSVTQLEIPLIQSLLAQSIIRPNVSQKGIALRDDQSVDSPHRLSRSLMVIGALAEPSDRSVLVQCESIRDALFSTSGF